MIQPPLRDLGFCLLEPTELDQHATSLQAASSLWLHDRSVATAIGMVTRVAPARPGGNAIIANTGGDALLLRTGAGYDFFVLAHLPPGAAVKVLEGPVYGADGNPWYKIDADGTVGYAFAAFLVRPEVAPAAPAVGSGVPKTTLAMRA